MVGSVTLLLPWLSVYLVRDLEFALRQGQAEALRSTVSAVASRIVESRDMWFPLHQLSQRLSAHEHGWLVPIVDPSPVLDGYLDEWYQSDGSSGECLPPPIAHELDQCWLGRTHDTVFVALRIKDVTRDYFDPSAGLRSSDHLRLHMKGQTGEASVAVYSAAAGTAHVAHLADTGILSPEYRIKAVINDLGNGLAVEMQVPKSWIDRSLAISFHDGQANVSPLPVAQLRAVEAPVLLEDLEVSNVFQQFHQQGMKLRIVAGLRWPLAQYGSLERPEEGLKESWFRWLLRQIIAVDQLPAWSDASLCCLPDSGELSFDQPHVRWLESAGRPVAQVSVPLDGSDARTGMILLAEQSSASVDLLAGGAAGRLLGLAFLVSAVVALVLLGYATLLSVRIRSLSRTARAAVDAHGRIIGQFHPSRMRDEIGDLSRDYYLLLSRTEQYTLYLEGMSQKLSHELRTPIAIVRSSLDNLTFGNISDEDRVYVARAMDGLTRLSRVFDAMSSATRIENSLRDSEKGPLDLVSLLSELVTAYTGVYRQLDIRLICRCQSATVWGNSDFLAQMVDKLVENAVDFTTDTGLIELSLGRTGRFALIEIFNTGSFIPENIRSTLFDSLVSSRQPSNEGQHLGLGLYVVRLVAQFHGGRVDAENDTQRQGVVFKVTLPLSMDD